MSKVMFVVLSCEQANRMNASGGLNSKSAAVCYGDEIKDPWFDTVVVLDEPIDSYEKNWLNQHLAHVAPSS
jgi:hypothetical protein